MFDNQKPALFTNRALARIRQENWHGVLADAQSALDLKAPPPITLKSYTYLGQSHLALKNPEDALRFSLKAYELAVEQNSPSVAAIAQTVMQAKKEKWEVRERERIMEEQSTLRDVFAVVERDAKNQRMQGVDWEVVEERERKLKGELEEVFARADAERCRRREVPEWLVDQISFGIMLDPVLTKNGHSYDRSTLFDHLKRSQTDPLTREPLVKEDLRPNLALRQASEDFLEENGWAVDW